MESSVIRKVALYCSVSTTEQSCDMQFQELREYAARRGLEITGEYIDVDISGSKESRPELSRLMKDAKMRYFDAKKMGAGVGTVMRAYREEGAA